MDANVLVGGNQMHEPFRISSSVIIEECHYVGAARGNTGVSCASEMAIEGVFEQHKWHHPLRGPIREGTEAAGVERRIVVNHNHNCLGLEVLLEC